MPIRPNFYTREQLEQMPIPVLRNVDIKDRDEQNLIQDILNARLMAEPIPNDAINLSDINTDFRSVEEEKAAQKIIDERKAAYKAKIAGTPKYDAAFLEENPKVRDKMNKPAPTVSAPSE